MTRPHLDPVAPQWDWEHDMPPAPALRAGNTLYLSGQIALAPDGTLAGAGDLVAQARQCFENIRAILARAGATMQDVVKMTTYFTCNLDEAVASEYWAVRKAFFGEHRPASTGVQVRALLMPACLIEIDVIAVLPGDRS
ncbi:2-iminobutanoate/2-iminopropanoate deaminase [Cupriavidus yeoncheonensis]|uniref:2-iminobutanoate/2-iminopropanoate deaminase n=1 Tax=Cupriavidus yeoncheonensis TaxID=1462994 RepID=A0A916MZ78_9BURK|nr:RidA family protein [Cupriavidus yeoncheonensis]CAG2150672.1 2-iminobutanoate/2-iminopropanoate deaminase [Cupriavidus yeoncheonensis]